MRVLLNVTNDELNFIGGDYSYYRSLLALGKSSRDLNISILQQTEWRRWVRQLEVLARRLGQERLFAESRRVPIAAYDIQAIQPDVIFSTVLLARLPRRNRIANVFYSQGINSPLYYAYEKGLRVEQLARIYQHYSRHVNLMVVGTQDGQRRLLELCPRLECPTVFIPQLVLTPALEDLSLKPTTERIRFLFVGRDYIRKGLPEVLAAYAPLAKRADLDIVTVADCPLQAQAPANIRWHTNLSDAELKTLYQQAHVLVVPTHADTYNLVLVEAMAQGCAIVTSDLPPMDEIAPPQVVGEIVPRGDIPRLTDVLKRLVDDHSLLQTYMQGALDRYRTHYAPEQVLPHLLAAFQQAIDLAT